MRKLFAILLCVFAVSVINAQDTIVFKNNGHNDTVMCKIKSVSATNIFYIEKNEHKSDYMRNVQYCSKSQHPITKTTISDVKSGPDMSGNEIMLVQNVWTVLSIFSIRSKVPTAPTGYSLKIVYSLPSSGLLVLLYKTPTHYVYEKRE